MRIVATDVNRKIYFYAVDASDFTTPEDSLTSGWTITWSIDGGSVTTYTSGGSPDTDTMISEADAGGSTEGVYYVNIDVAAMVALTAGDDSYELMLHISHASVAPIVRTVEIYRPKITEGNTLDVTATGAAGIDWGNIENKTTANDLSGTDIQLVDTASTVTGGATSAEVLDVPTVAEFNARTLLAASYFDPAADTVANVTLVATTSTVTDGATATALATVDTVVDAILVDTGTTLPAQIGAIGAATGGALNFPATSDNASAPIDPSSTVKVGVPVPTNTFTSTAASDAVYHVIEETAAAVGVIDWVYGFNIGGNRTGSTLVLKGFVNGNNDDLTVSTYNHVGSAWEEIGILEGSNSTANVTTIIPLLSRNTGTAAELGNVYIRIDGTGLSTSADLNIDQILVEGINIGQSIGYDQGAVHVDTLIGVAGVEAFVNGVADNPVDLWASAQTIATSVGVSHFHINNGSTITLDSATDNTEISGDEYTVACGGFSINNSSVSHGLAISGTFLGYPHILHTGIGPSGLTGPGAKIGFGAIRGSVVSNATTYQWVLHDCWGVSVAASKFDFGAVVAAQTVYITAYTGPITIDNMDHADDKLYLSGNGNLVIGASSTTGTIYLSGNWTVTATGTTTLVRDTITTDVSSILVDTAEIGTAGVGLTDVGGMSTAMKSEVNAEVVDVIRTDTLAELAGVPAATATLADKVNWLYMLARNKGEQIATTKTLYADDTTTPVATSTVSDDGTTFTREEYT
jgi:hypothetical protein